MELPHKRLFVEKVEDIFAAYPLTQDACAKRYGIESDAIRNIFKKNGKLFINGLLSDAYPKDFWMVTTIKQPTGMCYNIYFLDKEKVLENMGLTDILEYFS